MVQAHPGCCYDEIGLDQGAVVPQPHHGTGRPQRIGGCPLSITVTAVNHGHSRVEVKQSACHRRATHPDAGDKNPPPGEGGHRNEP